MLNINGVWRMKMAAILSAQYGYGSSYLNTPLRNWLARRRSCMALAYGRGDVSIENVFTNLYWNVLKLCDDTVLLICKPSLFWYYSTVEAIDTLLSDVVFSFGIRWWRCSQRLIYTGILLKCIRKLFDMMMVWCGVTWNSTFQWLGSKWLFIDRSILLILLCVAWNGWYIIIQLTCCVLFHCASLKSDDSDILSKSDIVFWWLYIFPVFGW